MGRNGRRVEIIIFNFLMNFLLLEHYLQFLQMQEESNKIKLKNKVKHQLMNRIRAIFLLVNSFIVMKAYINQCPQMFA